MDGSILASRAGAYTFEYERLLPGLDAWGAGQRLRELVPAVKKLWEGDYAHQGEFSSFPMTTASPKPVQADLPIWIAARDPNSHDFAVASGCNVQVTPLASGDGEVTSLMERFNTACGNHPTSRAHASCCCSTLSSQTLRAETEQLSKDLSAFYCMFGAWFQNKRPIHQGIMDPLSDAEMAAMANFPPQAVRKNLVIGEPDEVIARLRGYAALGYDQFSIWIDSGLSHARKKKSLELFIRHVLPAFELRGSADDLAWLPALHRRRLCRCRADVREHRPGDGGGMGDHAGRERSGCRACRRGCGPCLS